MANKGNNNGGNKGGGGNSGNGNKGVVGGKGNSNGGGGKASGGYAKNGGGTGGSNQTGWGGNPGGLYEQLHEFNTGTWNPGTPNPTPEPFLTQQDIEEYAEAREQYQAGLHQLDENYSAKQHENEYEEHEIEKGRVQGVENENWDAAARGLFKSSVRDGDLADIDATAEIKKTFLSDSLKALAIYNEGQKKAMEAKWGRYEEQLNRKKVENAEGVAANMPKWAVEPSFTPGSPGKAPSQPKTGPTPVKYPNGNKGPVGTAPPSKNGGTQAPSGPRGGDINTSPAKKQAQRQNNGGTTAYAAHAMGALYGKH